MRQQLFNTVTCTTRRLPLGMMTLIRTQCTDIPAKIESLKLRPSKEATYSVLTWGAREAPRDRTRVVMGSAEVWHYPWRVHAGFDCFKISTNVSIINATFRRPSPILFFPLLLPFSFPCLLRTFHQNRTPILPSLRCDCHSTSRGFLSLQVQTSIII